MCLNKSMTQKDWEVLKPGAYLVVAMIPAHTSSKSGSQGVVFPRSDFSSLPAAQAMAAGRPAPHLCHAAPENPPQLHAAAV